MKERFDRVHVGGSRVRYLPPTRERVDLAVRRSDDCGQSDGD